MNALLLSARRSTWVAIAAILGLFLVLACVARFARELEADAPSAQPAVVESTDGSWRAALGELLLPLVAEHDTEYAQGYSEEVFRSLDIGLGRAMVEQLLGPPLLAKEFSSGRVYWYYSHHGTRSGNYLVRILVFDREERLVARRSYFYLD